MATEFCLIVVCVFFPLRIIIIALFKAAADKSCVLEPKCLLVSVRSPDSRLASKHSRMTFTFSVAFFVVVSHLRLMTGLHRNARKYEMNIRTFIFNVRYK